MLGKVVYSSPYGPGHRERRRITSYQFCARLQGDMLLFGRRRKVLDSGRGFYEKREITLFQVDESTIWPMYGLNQQDIARDMGSRQKEHEMRD